MAKQRCRGCRCYFHRRPQNPNQRFCSKSECQRQRKSYWQKEKRKSDPDYRSNDRESQPVWRARNPDYWRRRQRRKRAPAVLSPAAKPRMRTGAGPEPRHARSEDVSTPQITVNIQVLGQHREKSCVAEDALKRQPTEGEHLIRVHVGHLYGVNEDWCPFLTARFSLAPMTATKPLHRELEPHQLQRPFARHRIFDGAITDALARDLDRRGQLVPVSVAQDADGKLVLRDGYRPGGCTRQTAP
ncbi:hypothetical protein SCOR_32420 [Sulfidibacter corallicola]